MSMRISTNTLFETGAGRIGDLQTRLNKLQEQISAGKRIMTPSDDPVGAAQVLELNQGRSVNTQFSVNRQNARNALELEEHVLQGVTLAIQNAQSMAVDAGNGSMDDQQRGFIANEIGSYMDELFGLANSRDAEGNFIFGGYRAADAPFVKTAAGADYTGDQGQMVLQVGPLRKIEINDAGSAVFDDIKTGNGRVTTIAGANKGSGVISNASVSGDVTGNSYRIDFTAADRFTITQGGTVTGPFNYVSGQSIRVGEYELNITGKPAQDDVFTVEPSKKEGLFETLTNLVALLKTPVSGEGGHARLTNGLNTAMNNLANALDTTLTVRAGVGSRLRELDSLDSQGEERDLLYAKSIQNLEDLDYTKAITDLSKQQIMLEAAQQSFVKTSGLSLFNFIS